MLECPKCGNTDVRRFSHIEDLPAVRHVLKLEDGRLVVDGLVHDHDYENPKNLRLCCQSCFVEFPVPTTIDAVELI